MAQLSFTPEQEKVYDKPTGVPWVNALWRGMTHDPMGGMGPMMLENPYHPVGLELQRTMPKVYEYLKNVPQHIKFGNVSSPEARWGISGITDIQQGIINLNKAKLEDYVKYLNSLPKEIKESILANKEFERVVPHEVQHVLDILSQARKMGPNAALSYVDRGGRRAGELVETATKDPILKDWAADTSNFYQSRASGGPGSIKAQREQQGEVLVEAAAKHIVDLLMRRKLR